MEISTVPSGNDDNSDVYDNDEENNDKFNITGLKSIHARQDSVIKIVGDKKYQYEHEIERRDSLAIPEYYVISKMLRARNFNLPPSPPIFGRHEMPKKKRE